MTALLFGATGMIGHSTLTAALSDDRVSRVVSVLRRPSGREHAKLEEIVHDDFFDYAAVVDRIASADACLFCLGISAAGRSEAAYRRVTQDLTLAAAHTLSHRNPAMTFVHVSGHGANVDGRQMWARVKGETEAALSSLPFKAVYHARPGYIQPKGGARSRTVWYRAFYAAASPFYPLLRRLAPRAVIDSEALGRALVEAGLAGAPRPVLDVPTLHLLSERAPSR